MGLGEILLAFMAYKAFTKAQAPKTAVPTPAPDVPPPAPAAALPAAASAPAPTTAPVATPVVAPTFPAPPPPSLPAWPDGWVADDPPPKEVVARAWALLPTLWAKGVGTRQVEMTGGRWLTYVAQLHGTMRGVTAFRVKGTPPAANAAPTSTATAAAAAANTVTAGVGRGGHHGHH